MGLLYDDAVIIRQSEKEDEPSVITVNCPDKTGLGCDLCHIILFFGLTVVGTGVSRLNLLLLHATNCGFYSERNAHSNVVSVAFRLLPKTRTFLSVCVLCSKLDVSTDGKWCYIVFWVVGRPSTRWGLLKKRLMGACPSFWLACGMSAYLAELQPSKPPDVFLLKFCCNDRSGLLHVNYHKSFQFDQCFPFKTYCAFNGRIRELMHTKRRKEDVYDHLKAVLGDDNSSCEIEIAGPDISASSQEPSFLSDAIIEDMFNIEMLEKHQENPIAFKRPSITFDNLLSPSHTLIQIVCQDHKGLLYDIMRTLKDYNIQISYVRFTTKEKTECELDLFIMQADGKKIADLGKQNSLRCRLEMELSRPVRVALISRIPDTELVVANPVESSGKGRPLVFYDITLALKMLSKPIVSAEIRRHVIDDREWEVYRVLLDEGDGNSISTKEIEETVWKMLMSWG
ncbi:ACT domain-containing protein ACR10 [Sesamum angolense]|uniref:ACT domain-containing protein ACR n=1 Tax=Sesamum angolense TaxID=2727404 RepID=A0AAE1W459_9LAMI|nr:ACT domain-containing protein ACR10 [Sesamum angolense]